MNLRKCFLLGLVPSLLLALTCWAQIPAVPVVPAVPAVPAPPNLWSFLLPNAVQKANCKTCFCNSPLGQMTSAATAPMSAMTGGLITNRCAKNANDLDLLKPPGSSEGAAAQIKADEAAAKARRDAVRFLGTVDCNYFPEATDALVNSLRKDPSECVRFEAALALGNGCCCNAKTMKALEMSFTGSDKDGAPPERSDRVRAAALDAYTHCPPLPVPEQLNGKKDGIIQKTEAVMPGQFPGRLAVAPHEQVAANARGLLVNLQQANTAVPAGASSGAAPPIHRRAGSLTGLVGNAITPNMNVAAPASARAQGRPLSLYEVITTRNTKQEVSVPVSAPATSSSPREFRSITEAQLPARMPTGAWTPDQPRESTGYITPDAVPAPSPFRTVRP